MATVSGSTPVVRNDAPLWDICESAGGDLIDRLLAFNIDIGFLTMFISAEGDAVYSLTAGALALVGLGAAITVDNGEYSLDPEAW